MIQTPLAPDIENDRVIGAVSIGRGTYLGMTRFQTYIPSERIEIGRYCSIADDVCISGGGQHHPELPSTWPFDNFLLNQENPTRSYKQVRTTVIGSDVWIGDGAYIGGGVCVGHGAIIGAKAVVFSDAPAYAIVIGNPAKTLRYRFSESQIAELLKIEWWNWSPDIVRSRLEWFYRPIEDFIAEFRVAGAEAGPKGEEDRISGGAAA